MLEKSQSQWYKLVDENTVDSPALLIYSERVSHNIDQLVGMVDDPGRLRPHMKTNKSREAAKMLLDRGIVKFKCATIAEAETLATSGAKDILLAYQPSTVKLARLIQLIKAFPTIKFSCLIDNEESARKFGTMAQEHQMTIDLYIDINLGMGRTGILPGQPALALFRYIQSLDGLEAKGLHAYDGHFRDADFEIRTQRCDTAFQEIEKLRDQLSKEGHQVTIVAGGTPTFPIHARRSEIDCSPGTFIYWDQGYSETCKEQPFIPAALVMTRIISKPSENTVCLDLGHKSIAPENPLDQRVRFLNAEVVKFLGQSEEHLVVEVNPGHQWSVGDVWYGVPIHICPTVALYEEGHEVVSGSVVSTWRTVGRDRSITF
jgi:D-serine deaminase-like pyridoxal phosphate-dependent protein